MGKTRKRNNAMGIAVDAENDEDKAGYVMNLGNDDQPRLDDGEDGVGVGDQNVTVDDLIGSLGNASDVHQLRKDLGFAVKKKRAAVDVPLPKVQQDRLDRSVAYASTRKEVSKWQPIVKANRQAEQLKFPSREGPDHINETTASLTAKMKATSDLEKEIQQVLEHSGMKSEKDIQKKETDELQHLTEEELKERQEKLMKMRNVLMKYELKAKRIKLLRKRKEKQGVDEKDDVELKRAEERLTLRHKNNTKWVQFAMKHGKSAVDEQLRMHQELVKKINQAEGDADAMDDPDLAELDEMVELSDMENEEDRAKVFADVKAKLSNDADEGEKPKGIYALKFMQKALQKDKENALKELEEFEVNWSDGDAPENSNDDSDSNDENDEVENEDVIEEMQPIDVGAGHKHVVTDEYTPINVTVNDILATKITKSKSSAVIAPAEKRPIAKLTDGIPPVPEREMKKRTIVAVQVTPDEMQAPSVFKPQRNPWLVPQVQTSKVVEEPSKRRVVVDVKSSNAVESRHDTPVDKAAKKSKSKQHDVVDDGQNGSVDETSEQPKTEQEQVDEIKPVEKPSIDDMLAEDVVREAMVMAGDVEQDFEEEKAKTVIEESGADKTMTKDIAMLALPGWGDWGGAQLGPSKRTKRVMEKLQKEREKTIDTAKKNRKDAELKHVILSEKTNKKAKEFMTQRIPFGYSDKATYERAIANPLGPEYNTRYSYESNVAPGVVVQPGTYIQPLNFQK